MGAMIPSQETRPRATFGPAGVAKGKDSAQEAEAGERAERHTGGTLFRRPVRE